MTKFEKEESFVKKNLLALLLALAMVLALMAGCGSNANDDAPAPTEAPAANDSNNAPPADDGNGDEAEEPEAPAEKEAPSYPLVEDTATITYWQAWPPFLSAISEPEDAAIFAQLEDVTNVHLEITSVSTESSDTELMMRCASGDLLDLIQGMTKNYTGGGTKALADEMIFDLKPLLEEYSYYYWNIINEDPNIIRGMTDDDGHMPGFYGIYTEYFYTDQGFFIRKDFLDDEGLSVPKTVAELDEVLAAFKARGLTDPLVIQSTGQCEFLARAYDCNTKVIDGEVVNMSGSDNEREYFKKINEYYKNGYINPDFLTYTSDIKPPEAVVNSGNAGLFKEDPAALATYYMMTNDPDNFELAPQGVVRVNEGDVLNNGYIGVKISNKYTMSISTNCENPGLVIQYLDYLFTDDGVVLSNWGIEGETYTINDAGEKEFTELITNNPDAPWQLAQNLFINPGFASYVDLSVERLTYNDCQNAAVPTWIDGFDSSDETLLSDYLTYTSEEAEQQANIQSDLDSYQESMRLAFITGASDPNDDAVWENYVNTLQTLRIDELTEITQAAYTRFINR